MIKDIINHDRYAPQYTQEATRSPLIYCWNRRQGPHQGAIMAEHEQSDPNQGFLTTLEHTGREPFFLTSPSGSI